MTTYLGTVALPSSCIKITSAGNESLSSLFCAFRCTKCFQNIITCPSAIQMPLVTLKLYQPFLTSYKIIHFTEEVTQISRVNFCFLNMPKNFFGEKQIKLLITGEKCFKTKWIFSNIMPFQQVHSGKKMKIQSTSCIFTRWKNKHKSQEHRIHNTTEWPFL